MNLSELQALRESAGSRYSNAVEELRTSLIDLAALDHVLDNRNIPSPSPRTFHKLPTSLEALEHDEFLPHARDRLFEAIAARRDEILKGLNP